MQIILCENELEVAKAAGVMTLAAMAEKDANIAITAGQSPKQMYEYIIPLIKDNPMFQDVVYYNFDEIPQLNEQEGLTMQALRQIFFNPADIKKDQIQILNEHNYDTWEDKLKSIGYLDYVILGLGKDGHFCGNLPQTCDFHDETHKVDCSLNQKLYDRIKFLSGENINKVPPFYVTMGPKTIMQTKKIVMIVTGIDKAEIAEQVFFHEVNKNYPSSIFQLHPDFTLIIDKAAASKFPK